MIAPDSFKGSASAVDIAQAIREGWLSVRRADQVEVVPMADGGEGTLDAIASARRTVRREIQVAGPDDQRVDAEYLLLDDGTAVVELALVSGLQLTDRRRPLKAHSRGFGAAVAAPMDAGALRLLLAIGGSGCNDGGAGMLAELGARLIATDGSPIGDGGGSLADLARADLSRLRPLPIGGVDVLTDVRSPLLGPTGASHVFGPQKGASASDVAVLERGLSRLAEVLGADPGHWCRRRVFAADAPDTLWVTDITQHRTGEGWVYLAAVIDVFSRRCVGWSIADHLRTELVVDAIDMARWRKPGGTIVHSDRGAQFTSWLFRSRLREAGLMGSMGKVASAYDNALMESFFGSMQIELLDRRAWPTRAELGQAMFEWIEAFYNPRRRHSALGYQSPIEFENHQTATAIAA